MKINTINVRLQCEYLKQTDPKLYSAIIQLCTNFEQIRQVDTIAQATSSDHLAKFNQLLTALQKVGILG